MGPDPEGIFTAGLLLGILGTLLIQWYGRRRAAKAAVEATGNSQDKEEHEAEIKRLQDRIAVMERITTDPGVRTAQEIEELRHGS